MDWFLYDNGPRHERVKYQFYKSLTEKGPSQFHVWINFITHLTLYSIFIYSLDLKKTPFL